MPTRACNLSLGVVLFGVLASSARPCIAEQFAPLDLRQVKVGGEIGRRIDMTINNHLMVLNLEKDFLTPLSSTVSLCEST